MCILLGRVVEVTSLLVHRVENGSTAFVRTYVTEHSMNTA
jgi:hypothetical protein